VSGFNRSPRQFADERPVVGLLGVEGHTVDRCRAASLAAMDELVTLRRVVTNSHRAHRGPALAVPIAGAVVVDMERPQAVGTVVAVAAIGQRTHIGPTVEADEPLVLVASADGLPPESNQRLTRKAGFRSLSPLEGVSG
jgi:hypothetical protein